MVERGGCHFVTKSRNIAKAGGKVALVIDTKNEDIENVIMSDDGTGMGIRIPSLLIGNKDGQKLKDFMSKASPEEVKQIIFNIEFNMPVKRDIVNFEYWYTQADQKSVMFIKNMVEFLKDIIDDIVFNPSFVTWNCPKCDSKFKHENCLGNGKYCVTHHEGLEK